MTQDRSASEFRHGVLLERDTRGVAADYRPQSMRCVCDETEMAMVLSAWVDRLWADAEVAWRAALAPRQPVAHGIGREGPLTADSVNSTLLPETDQSC